MIKNYFSIFICNSKKKSITGPIVPERCYAPSIVPMPNGDGVVLLGCSQTSKNIYQLSWIGDELQWITKKQKLEYPRTYGPVAMWIPDELTSCTSGE